MDLCARPGVACDEFAAVARQCASRPTWGCPARLGRRPAAVDGRRGREATFPRAASAARCGLHAGFGFPILYSGGDVGGVIEVFSRRMSRPDDELLAVFAALGSQIGQFIDASRRGGSCARPAIAPRPPCAAPATACGTGICALTKLTLRCRSELGHADDEVADDYSEWESGSTRLTWPRPKTIRDYLDDPAAASYELEHRLRHKSGGTAGFWPAARRWATSQGRPYRMAGSAHRHHPAQGDGSGGLAPTRRRPCTTPSSRRCR